MDAILTKAAEALVSQFGFQGIVLCGLAVWNVWQFSKYDKLFKLYCTVQEKRIEESRELIELAGNVKNAIDVLTALIRDRAGRRV